MTETNKSSETRHVIMLPDGVPSLPLNVLYARTLEEIDSFSQGMVKLTYKDPEYSNAKYVHVNDMLDRIACDFNIAVETVKSWPAHVSNYQYFVQLSDNEIREKTINLHRHTTMASTMSDVRLGIETSDLWSTFNLSLLYGRIHSDYRNDENKKEKYAVYSDRSDRLFEQLGLLTMSVTRLVERLVRQIDLKSAVWASLPPLSNDALEPNSEGARRPIRLFYSYSHKDEALRDKLDTHIAALKHSGAIESWHDRRIGAGDQWKDEIDSNLEAAEVVLLLISSNFLGSRYCYSVEMKRAMERHEKGEARVVPIILRACDWMHSPFAALQALPTDARPVTSWKNRDEAFTDIAKGIRREIEMLA